MRCCWHYLFFLLLYPLFSRRSTPSPISACLKVYDQINANQVFGTAHILKILECSERTARNLIRKMKEMDVLVSVTGKGKGMYRLKLEDRRNE